MAGVYIPDFPMPTDKPVAIVIHPDGTAYLSEIVSGVLGYELRNCEVLPTPDHGRLIDADKLISRLVEQRTVILHELPAAHTRWEGYTDEDYIFDRNGDLISMLRNQAAVIPADKEGDNG